MRPKPTSIRLAMCAALGIVAFAPAARAAPVLPNGVYQATINITPLTSPTPTAMVIPGSPTTTGNGRSTIDGTWNSTFTFGGSPTRKSQAMTDNATDIYTNPATKSGTTYGSSKKGAGAGSWDMTVNGGTFTASHFQVDAIFATAGGTFVQYGSITGGTIDQTTGAMTLDPSGRKGAVNGPTDSTTGNLLLYNEPWSIPPTPTTDVPVNGTTGYAEFTTGTTTNSGTGSGTITGHGIVANGNGTYNVILVSAGNVGTAWGAFGNASYMETWNVNLKTLLIAKAVTASAQPGVAKLIDVEANDTINTSVAPTIVLPKSTSASGAALSVSAGKVSYTASTVGTDTFQYELKDSKGDTTPPATVAVTVTLVLTATPDQASTPEGQPVTIDVLKNDTAPSGATVTVTTQPVNGNAVPTSSNQVLYTPDPGFVGTDTFQYTDTDSASGATSKPATVTVTVKAAFQAATSSVSVGPGAIATTDKSSGLVTTQQLITAGILADSGVSQQCIGGCFDFKVTNVGSGGQAVVAMLPLTQPIPTTGARFREYISGKWQDFDTSNGDSVASVPGSATSCPPPSGNYQPGLVAGDYCVRLTITDGGSNDGDGTAGAITNLGGIATGTGTPAPVVKNDTASTLEGQPVTISVLANDSGVSGATVTIPTLPVHGTAVPTSSNQVLYTPNSGYVGPDTFSYKATVSGKSSTATVTVTVNAAFQAATSGVSVGPGAIATMAGTSGLVTTPQLTAAGISADSGVSQQCIGGCFDFKAAGVASGKQATVAMLPLTQPIPSGAHFREYINGKWQDFDTKNGDSVASALGSATSCPPLSSSSYQTGLATGDYCVRLTITDGGPNDGDGTANGAITALSGIATGTGSSSIVVPVVKSDTAYTPEDRPITIDVLANDSGVSGAIVTIPTLPAHGNATANGSNQVVYTPNSGYVGPDTFSYKATVSGKSSTATVTVTMKAGFQSTVSVGPGAIASNNGSSGIVTAQQLLNASPSIPPDSGVSQQCIGGCFDFEATVPAGGQVPVVMLPLTKPIPSNAHFREYINGKWQDFATSNGSDSVASAPGSATSCPPPSSTKYVANKLIAGDYCVRLTITDGGPNDSTELANGTITNLGGIATGTGTPAPVVKNDTASTLEGQPVTISVLANDSGVSGATVTIPTLPVHGSATLSGSKVVYTPNSGYVGPDTFSYKATVSGKSSTATVTVTVNAAFQTTTSGVSVGPGTIATTAGTSGWVTTPQLTAAGISADSGVSQQCIGGCFDFKAAGVASGKQATVVMLPLIKPIPSGAHFREYINGKWQDFDTKNGDSVASAPGSATSCPPLSSSSYQTGLATGDYCVRLTVTDGGPNDGDGTANGAITDSGGIATGTGTPAPVVKNETASAVQGGKAVTVMIPALAKGATVTIPTLPAHGTAVPTSSNQVLYTPNSGYAGLDTFSYKATVGGKSSTATVTVAVNAIFQAATSGVSVGPGIIAAKYKSPGYREKGLVTTQQLIAAKIPADSGVSSQCIGGCFDFKATGVVSGHQAKVVMLPLTKPIPSGAKLRKYISGGGWQDFVTSNGDSVASALGSKTSCPSSSSTKYQTGLTAGDYCVQLTITDGGKNDSDGLANGVITDPSGIATGTGSSGSSGSSSSFGGCTLGTDANPWHGGSWWLIGGMIGWLGFTRRRRSPRRA